MRKTVQDSSNVYRLAKYSVIVFILSGTTFVPHLSGDYTLGDGNTE